MDKEQIGIPKLRFPGFTGAWEQRRLGDYLSIPTKEPITDINELKLMTLKLNLEGITLSANRETLKLGATKYYKRHEGQLLYGKQNFFHGSIALIPKEAEGYATSGDVPALDISNVNSKYLVDYISRPSYFKAKEALATGTGSKRIHEKTLLNFKIAVPSLEEQNAISDFITNYTNLIALHQRKLEHLKQQKNGLLQKMFPKNGESVPDVRFPGFTDPWEQRKLGDQMYIKARIGWQALKKDEYMETGDFYLITGTDIDESRHIVDLSRCFYVSEERYDMDKKIQLQNGDIIVTKDGTIGKVAMVTDLDKPATLNSHLFVLRDLSGHLDKYFLLTILSSDIFKSFVESTKTGSTLTGLPQKTIVKFKFQIPSIQEQRKISTLFKSVDSLIALYQRKLEHLELLKKGLLQQMFV
ncbi:restriction endonuclease subunit S [Ligilactobacillus agilis]|uniref:restriction endonuclease subunit S n=2 Tax=Ligilactobacillus agilis TaxID=1601 RepID=UPI0019597523|nr:restriction endonuclease subunit S [Ligilactobacillus agilis]MBM6762768.1 restriction endonuclease subunit S [Ligilactobacillus agilis]